MTATAQSMYDREQPANRSIGSYLDAGVRYLAAAIAGVREEWRVQRDLRHLLTLDDDQLRDVGLTREQVLSSYNRR